MTKGEIVQDIAWAAGLFEGEGSVSFARNHRSRHIVASIGMTDKDVIEKFQTIMGMGTIYNYAPQKTGWKPMYVWRVGSYDEVKRLVEMFLPWFCARRTEKALRVLAQYELAEPPSIKASRERTKAITLALRTGDRTQEFIAKEFGVCPATVHYIKKATML